MQGVFCLYICVMIIVYHNPRCSKSREACDWLKNKKKKIQVIEYLKTPPSIKELKEIIKMLGIKPEEFVRKKEPVFIETFQGKKLTDAQWIKAMVQFPVLIERPIIIKDGKAIIARPIEKLAEFLK